MKQTYRLTLLLFLAAIIAGCNAKPETQPTPSTIATTQIPIISAESPTVTYLTAIAMASIVYSTPTPTYQPRITDTPTLNYQAIIDHYLTPFTPNPNTATITATPWPTVVPSATHTRTPTPLHPTPPNIPDSAILSRITAQHRPVHWTPTPPPLVDGSVVQDINFTHPIDEKIANGRIQYIQAATDLMNFTHADKDIFLKYVDGWTVDTWSARGYTTWFVENDFDHDGQPEWLVNIPLYSSDPKTYCCSQLMMIFEKTDDLYHPVYYQAGGGLDIDWHIMEIADLNNDGNLEIVTSQSCHCDPPPPNINNIGAWDGNRWRNEGNIDGQIIFAGTDENGTVKLVTQRGHTYNWQDGQFKLKEEKQSPQPNFDPSQAVADVHKALMAHNPKEAIRLAEPILQRMQFSCDDPKSYTAIQAMFAYALDHQPQAVQNTINQITKLCKYSNDGKIIQLAQIFGVAYQKTQNAMLSCKAMNRFALEKKSDLYLYIYYSNLYPLCSDNEITEHQ